MNEKTAKYLLYAGGAWLVVDFLSPFIGGQVQEGVQTIEGLNPLPVPIWAILAGIGAFGFYGVKGVAGVAVVWFAANTAVKSLAAKQAGV